MNWEIIFLAWVFITAVWKWYLIVFYIPRLRKRLRNAEQQADLWRGAADGKVAGRTAGRLRFKRVQTNDDFSSKGIVVTKFKAE